MAVALGDGEAVAALVQDDVRVALTQIHSISWTDASSISCSQRSWLATGFFAAVIQHPRCAARHAGFLSRGTLARSPD